MRIPHVPGRSGVTTWLTLLLALFLQACASVPDRAPPPERMDAMPEIPGIPNARFWGDEMPEIWAERLRSLTEQDVETRFPGIVGREHHYLAISGGGPDGAFGAGLLKGWADTGTRPEFTLVTGISTGSLTAPFAFLGAEHDATLKTLYTTTRTEQLVRLRSWIEIATGDSAVDTSPLRALIDRFVDDRIVAEIAAEHARGRRLYIGTTNLDAARPVIWDITQIAASGHPDARKLIGDIMLASASIPGAFPPIYFEVELDGQRFDEMHVDGGTAQQVFVYPSAANWPAIAKRLRVQGKPSVYVIRNSPLKPRFSPTGPTIIPISTRSIASLIRTQGIGDLNLIYLLTQRDGNDFNLAFIPDGFDMESKEPFDPEYMGALYELGYRMARDGYPWQKTPPGI